MNGIYRLTVLVLLSASLTGCMVVPVQEREPYYEEYAQPVMPPPPPRYEYPSYAPVVGSVWISGNWNWGGSRYVWVPGRWETPRSGHYWLPHRWERDGNHWRQHGGTWERDTREQPNRNPEPRTEHHDLRPDPIPFARPERNRSADPKRGDLRYEHMDRQPLNGSTKARGERNAPPPVSAREPNSSRDQRSVQRPTSETKSDQKPKGRHQHHHNDKESE